MLSNEREPNLRERLNIASNLVLLAARTFAAPAEVIWRRGFGREYLGIQAALALPAMFVWAALWPQDDPRPLFGFLLIYVVRCFAERVRSLRRQARGEPCHSRYNGAPSLQRFFPKWDETRIKQRIEPWATMALGGLLMQWTPPLGSFLLVSWLGLMASQTSDVASERRRAQDMYDAYVEQQIAIEEFRRMRGDDAGAAKPSMVEFPDQSVGHKPAR